MPFSSPQYVSSVNMDIFENAISEAEIAADTANTKKDLEDAETTLENAISIFRTATKTAIPDTDTLEETILEAEQEKEDVETSEDGIGVEPGKYWATADDISTFELAIQIATQVKDSPETQNEINQADGELKQAIQTFKGQKTLVD